MVKTDDVGGDIDEGYLTSVIIHQRPSVPHPDPKAEKAVIIKIRVSSKDSSALHP